MRDERSDDPRPEDDQEAIDRAFAELIADFHRPSHGPPVGGDTDGDPLAGDPRAGDIAPPDHPSRPPQPPRPVYGFRLDWDVPLAPQPGDHGASNDRWRFHEPPEPPEDEDHYVPPPTPPLTRPRPRMLVGWMAIAYAIVTMVMLAVGVPLPRWVGWLAVLAFLGGLALLFSQLPRHRPPDDDDGARL